MLGRGGGGCPDLGPNILGGDLVGDAIRIGYWGYGPTHWVVFGRIPPQDDPEAVEGGNPGDGRTACVHTPHWRTR